MEKFLLFVDGENDIAMYPVSRLAAVTCAADEAVLLRFNSSVEPAGGTAAANDLVTLTTTSGAAVEKAIFEAIARAISATGPQYNDGLITVCDDINSIFLHKDILSCAITLDT
jgi:hypothetical protein|tara:strand:+ start:229 stop:567 length:339 start_codon:yes stop_codon:yes gene_type:complete